MSEQFIRTEMLLGAEAMNRLSKARVAVFGIGGVGGHALEALVRSGVGTVDIIDNDTVAMSNLNRQLIATHSTVGMYKVDAAEMRIHDINPDCVVNKYNTFFLPETKDQFDFTQFDYVIDAIDTVSGKLALVECAKAAGVPIICSMGAGNKLDASAFEVADIYKTSVCPLARVMREQCRKRGIKKLKVVYSKEQPIKPSFAASQEEDGAASKRRAIPGSAAFVPSVAGLIIAGEVIRDLTGV
ncbi:MAG: tRNA threonylcarbamoyladenosine dehydratase [Clostridia bacterium]|nr:tRNA threonylcarbamoyladenosine dehydratase [Clostridia bacterium]